MEKLHCDLTRPTCAMGTMRKKINEIIDWITGSESSRGSVIAPNLLDNSDFRQPVNQRGESTYYGTGGYSIDRWIIPSGATLNVIPGKWIETNNFLTQRVPAGVLSPDKAYTVAWMGSDGVIRARQDGVNFTTISYELDYDEVYVNLECETVAILWAALYEGVYSVEDLPAYMPKGYAHELTECRRYFQLSGTATAFIAPENKGCSYMCVYFSPQMRLAPTVSINSTNGVSVELVEASPQGFIVRNTAEGSNAQVKWEGNAEL